MSGVVGSLMSTLLQVFRRVYQWKNFENRVNIWWTYDKLCGLTFSTHGVTVYYYYHYHYHWGLPYVRVFPDPSCFRHLSGRPGDFSQTGTLSGFSHCNRTIPTSSKML